VRPQTEADGLVESRAHIVLGIRTADCAPLLMAGTDANGHTHIAAVHAGWRGAVADIQSGAVRALGERGVSAGDLRVAIGPTIGFDAFEVGDEVVEAARHALDGDDPRLRKNERGRWHLDLPDLIERTLHRAGVSPEHVELVGGCTVQNEDLFFSYRRDRGKTGRHLAAIGLAPPYGSTEDTK
ncbi:MAG: polyphenol oxidase family protein, partial [Myxococcota bacterium]